MTAGFRQIVTAIMLPAVFVYVGVLLVVSLTLWTWAFNKGASAGYRAGMYTAESKSKENGVVPDVTGMPADWETYKREQKRLGKE